MAADRAGGWSTWSEYFAGRNRWPMVEDLEQAQAGAQFERLFPRMFAYALTDLQYLQPFTIPAGKSSQGKSGG
jgi:hypothetical protein